MSRVDILFSSFMEEKFLKIIKRKMNRMELEVPEKFIFLCGEVLGGKIDRKFRKEYFFFFEENYSLFTCTSKEKENLKKRFSITSLPEEIRNILGVGP